MNADEKQHAKSRNQVYICDLPNQTSDWRASEEEIFKLFKVRTCVFDVESILWPQHTNVNLDNLNQFDKMSGAPSKMYFDTCFDYLDTILEELDFDEYSWYEEGVLLPSKAEKLFAVIVRAMRKYKIPELDDKYEALDLQGTINSIKTRITDWLVILRTVLELKPSDILEISFEEVFRLLLPIVGLSCHRGGYVAKLKFQYKDKDGTVLNSVSSQPDLVVCNYKDILEGFAVAIVEVKKAVWKPNEQPGNDDKEAGPSSFTDDHPGSLLKTDYPNGNARVLTEGEKRNCSIFLPQLFGEVLASLNSTPMKLHGIPTPPQRAGIEGIAIPLRSVIGFGVVGFKVYVVNFMSVRREPVLQFPDCMHEIPLMKGLGIDILISEPLNLLKKNDRNKLFRLLFAMKHMHYEP